MKTLDRLFAEQVARTPDAEAVVDATTSLTYAELDRLANLTAARLRALGVGPDDRVGIVMDRAADMVVAVLGVLKAGGAYVPIEPAAPDQRIAEILQVADAWLTVTQPRYVDRLRALGQRPVTVPGDGCAPPVDAGTTGANLAAVYFTSGSTGRPKGVGCPHVGWVNRMRWMQDRHRLQVGETVLHKTTLTFDDAAVELFWPLANGGRVAILEPGAHRDPRAIIDAAIRYRAVHLQFVPSILDLFLDMLTDDDLAGLAALRSALSSGEALRPSTVKRFFARFGDTVELDNTWGVTEASIDSTFRRCRTADGAGPGESVSIGVPIDGTEVSVRNDDLTVTPPGEIGELYIGGAGVARGYLGDPRRTACAFVPAPEGKRLYRTGDRAIRAADGTLEFLGRVDDQVKIRGVRIELGEVETALLAHPAVTAAAVVAVPATAGGRQLAAYVVTDATVAELRTHLTGRLVSYAIPSTITAVAALPLAPNGKVDRSALATLAPATPEDPDPYVAPSTTTEETVAAIWCAVLGLDRVSVDRNFIDAGGHSLLAVRVLSRLRQAYELNLPLKLIFDHPTVASVAARIEEILVAELTAAQAH